MENEAKKLRIEEEKVPTEEECLAILERYE